ncbi:hypothetical protein C8J57DRAFT_1232265 [Mycena rebaudengoi]|nr:hypothetical protein C8J57DRAFT_1232265 [Mycena rebaudengoi]
MEKRWYDSWNWNRVAPNSAGELDQGTSLPQNVGCRVWLNLRRDSGPLVRDQTSHRGQHSSIAVHRQKPRWCFLSQHFWTLGKVRNKPRCGEEGKVRLRRREEKGAVMSDRNESQDKITQLIRTMTRHFEKIYRALHMHLLADAYNRYVPWVAEKTSIVAPPVADEKPEKVLKRTLAGYGMGDEVEEGSPSKRLNQNNPDGVLC